MQHNVSVITTSLLGLVIVSLTILPAAGSSAWVGNDDGEFDVALKTLPS